MKPGRELDALVAERVMHRPPCLNCNGPCDPRCSYHPHYSTDIAAAWEVFEKFRLNNLTRGADGWVCRFAVKNPHPPPWVKEELVQIEVAGETAPHAICLAALKACGAL